MNETSKPSIRLSDFEKDYREALGPHLDYLTGTRGAAFIKACDAGRINQTWRDGVDRLMLAAIERMYGLAPNGDREVFYRDSMRTGNKAVGYMLKYLFPEESATLALLNEVAIVSNHPSHAVELLAGTNNDPRLNFELQRAFMLGSVAADIRSRYHNKEVENVLLGLQSALDSKLYDGPRGYTREERFRVLHDSETNEVLWVEGVDGFDQPKVVGGVEKMYRQRMRPVDGVGLVMTNLRFKEPEAAVIKAFRTAAYRNKNNGRDIVSISDVSDLSGMMFVLKADGNHEGERVNTLVARVTDILRKSHGDSNIEFSDDPSVNCDPHQKQPDWIRKQAHVAGSPIPVELEFFTEKGYLRTKKEVGVFDPDKRSYTGEAWELYRISRMTDLIPYFFPRSIYYPDADNINLEDLAVQRLHSEAERLRLENRLLLPDGIIFQKD